MLKWAAPAALLAVFFLQSFLSSRIKSATFDEPAHIAAGLSYVSTGIFHANPQHPPLMIYLWGRELFGEIAAVGALFLYVLDPTMVAHSALVTMDVGLAAFSLAFIFALWKYTQAPSLSRQIWCGVALGCALGAKYTGV